MQRWTGFLRKQPQFQRFLRKKRSRTEVNQVSKFDEKRSRFLFSLMLCIFVILVLRAITIQILPPSADTLSKLAKNQYQKKIDLSPFRGPIFDRRGEPLAMSTRRPSFFINPRVFSPNKKEQKKLAKILDISPKKLSYAMNRSGYFAWLKRKVSKDQADAIKSMDLKGLNYVMEPARYYPTGVAASQLIGYVGIDNNGLIGLERQLESKIYGEPSHVVRSKDAKGRVIFTSSTSASPEKTGKRVILTIDRVIQEITEKALDKGLKEANASAGFAIVSDPHTGHLLAVANGPRFNPNVVAISGIKNARNRAFLDLFEPGSVVKPLIAAKAIAAKKTSLARVYDTDDGIYREDNWRIRDSHPEKQMSTEDILIHSSNIGIYKIAQALGPEKTYQVYEDFGIGSRANSVGFPNQSYGRVQSWETWRSIRFANISFGQGMLVSGLEIAQAFGAIANGGLLMKPLLIDRIEDPDGRLEQSYQPQVLKRVIPAEVAKRIRDTLEKAVTEGSGANAKLNLYSSAGKTGTSEKVDPETKSYAADLRIASFVGFAPVDDPHLVIYVVIDEPKNKPYYGGRWAAPVFKDIAEQTLQYLNVAPDSNLASSQFQPASQAN